MHLLQEFYVYVYTIFNYAICSQNGKTFFKMRIERGKITFILIPLITLDFYELRNEYLWPTYITCYYIHIGTLDIFFPSNHNIHKSSCGLCFWGSDPF